MPQYIMAVSEKRISRIDKKEDIKILANLNSFFDIELFTHNPWYLAEEGSDERTYTGKTLAIPLEPDEIRKAKEAFEKANKILKIYELVELK
jgi:hypothetical protein